MAHSFLKIHSLDNVVVALHDLEKGRKIFVDSAEIILQETVPAKHKIYIEDLEMGGEVRMYGVLIGKVTKAVTSGELMSTQNLKHAAEPYAFKGVEYQWMEPDVAKWRERTFMGYHRNDGSVGTANYWLFIPTVFCENRNLDVIKEALHNELGYAVTGKYKSYTKALLQAYHEGKSLASIPDFNTTANTPRVFENIDGIKFLNHTGGCGGTRQDSATLQNLLAAYADHPNVGGFS